MPKQSSITFLKLLLVRCRSQKRSRRSCVTYVYLFKSYPIQLQKFFFSFKVQFSDIRCALIPHFIFTIHVEQIQIQFQLVDASSCQLLFPDSLVLLFAKYNLKQICIVTHKFLAKSSFTWKALVTNQLLKFYVKFDCNMLTIMGNYLYTI